jgi:hypothetical protein
MDRALAAPVDSLKREDSAPILLMIFLQQFFLQENTSL